MGVKAEDLLARPGGDLGLHHKGGRSLRWVRSRTGGWLESQPHDPVLAWTASALSQKGASCESMQMGHRQAKSVSSGKTSGCCGQQVSGDWWRYGGPGAGNTPGLDLI